MTLYVSSPLVSVVRTTFGAILLLTSCLSRVADSADDQYELTEYRAADNLFSAHLPGHWLVDDKRVQTPGASFFRRDGGEMMSVSFFRAEDVAAEAKRYLLSRQGVFEEIALPLPPVSESIDSWKRSKVAGRDSLETEREYATPPLPHGIPAQRFRERNVVVLMRSGFFALRAGCRLPGPCTWKVFDGFLASFESGGSVQ
jgi:hypothetical protein